MSPEMYTKVQKTISFVDAQAKQRKKQEIEAKRKFQDPALFENDSDDEKPVVNKKFGKV